MRKNGCDGTLPMLVLLLFFSFSCESFSSGTEVAEFVPASVWSISPTYPAGQPNQRALERMIDGDWRTTCCFLDDSPSVTNASAPVTAGFVLDLGRVQRVGGMRFVTGRSWLNLMAENVSVFACDDREGKKNARTLKDNFQLPPVNSFNAVFVTWEPVNVRFLRVQINDSYGRPRGGTDWWRAINPRLGKQWSENDRRRCEFGWWWGCWLSSVRNLPKFTGGGPSYDVESHGGRFIIQIAEVSCFCGRPDDMPVPNAPFEAFPENRLERDWMYQDCGVKNVSMVANAVDDPDSDPIGPDVSRCFSSGKDSTFEQAMLQRVLVELKRRGIDVTSMAGRVDVLSSFPGNDDRWKKLYFDACRLRRQERLKNIRRFTPQFIYVKHYVFGGWTQIEPTDEVSDEQFFERNPDFHEGSQLCLATIRADGTVSNEVLIDKPHGIIRDPNLSFDARTLIFSMREDFKTDDNHLYRMDLADKKVRQMTFSPVVDGKTYPCSDTEPCFAPNGEIIFQSTRCAQLDVCWAHPTSNLYVCDENGRHIRRLAFDQVRTLNPQVLSDGRIIYTRWEYNDRNPFFQQSLFAMNADGTAQMAYYGNNSEYPAALIHSRSIPGSGKVITVISGHHVLQKGKLAILDQSKGTEGNVGIEYVAGASPDGASGRRLSGIHSSYNRWSFDLFGQAGPQWQYPYAFDECNYLVSFIPEGCHFMKGPFSLPFGVYYMTDDGIRELLAFDWGNSCGQAIPVMPTQRPQIKASQVDWQKTFGSFYVQDVYAGPGLEGVKKGTARRLRVVALEYRAAGISRNWNHGVAGDSLVNTPVAIENGSQDVKHVLGEVDIEADGSAYFEVPARTAVYFQLLDEKGRCLQTMRSWTMVLPGERFGCVGCHENKLQAVPVTGRKPDALNNPARKLQPLKGQPRHPLMVRLDKESPLDNVDLFLGINRSRSLDPNAAVEGFSYRQQVQPLWDKHCVSCHQGNVKDPDIRKRSALSLKGDVYNGKKEGVRLFTESYIALTGKGSEGPLVNWVSPESMAVVQAPGSSGSMRSGLMDFLEPSHYDVQLTDSEKMIVACWIDLAVPFCGSYAEANAWEKQEWQVESNTWGQPQKQLYEYFQQKRAVFAGQELSVVRLLAGK